MRKSWKDMNYTAALPNPSDLNLLKDNPLYYITWPPFYSHKKRTPPMF